MTRKKVIAGNWKMYLTQKEALDLASKVVGASSEVTNKEILLFPTFLAIPVVAEAVKNSSIGVGGQNLYFEEKGAFTGEVSACQLVEVGCSHVLIGHSERRHYFREDYETVNKKIKIALKNELKVMLCVGESLEERENSVTEMVVVDQLESAFEGVKASSLAGVYLAYEPIWAIGTGKTATPDDAAHVHQIIRKTLTRIFSDESVAQKMRILYGGSVKPDNIKDLMAKEDVDGALVGGASLNYESFLPLLHYDQK